MLKLADFIIRKRWTVIGVIAALTILLGWQATKVGLNADFSTYLSQDEPLVQQYNRIGDIFGGNSIGIVLVTADDVFSPENLDLIKRLTEAYGSVDGITYVTSLANVVDFRKTEWGLQVGELLPRGEIPQDPEKLASLKAYVMAKDRYEGNLVSADGTTTAIILRFASNGNKVVNQFATANRVKAATDVVVAAEALPTGTRVYYGGMPFLIFNMTLLITNNLLILVPLMLLVLLLVLYLGFRHWAGLVFPLLVVIISDIWIVGIMGILGLKFNLLTGIVPVVLLALGSADGIHLLKRYFERRRLGESAETASRRVFQDMGTPIMLTTITTIAGFASLVISDFSVIKEFGVLTAAGVFLALVVTLTLLPALLSFGITPKSAATRAYTGHRFWDGLSTLVYRHKLLVLAGALVLIVISAFGIPRIVKDVDWSLCLQKGSAPFHAEMLLREKFGGSLPIQVLIDGDMKDPAVLRRMREIERRLDTIPLVSKSQSIAGIIAEMNAVMNGRYVVPETRQGVANLWFLIEGKDMMQQMVANQDREGLLQAKLSTWHTGSLVAAVDSINAFLATLPDKMAVIDLGHLQTASRDTLLQVRRRQMLRNLRWDLQKAGIRLPDGVVQRMVNEAMNTRLDGDGRESVQRAVVDYLRSPEAELDLPATVRQRLGRVLARQSADLQAVDVDALTQSILRRAPGVNKDDAGFLAESLVEIARVAAGEARLAPAMALLQQQLPDDGTNRENLLRDVKGTLWQANERRISIGAPLAEALLSPQEKKEALVRQVQWQFNQTGLAPVLNRMEEELIPTQVESLLTSMLFVIILLAFIHRSMLGALLAVIPISITILVNFAVMGYLGIGLDSFTAMIASIAIGLGIDTDIHFVSRLRAEIKKDGNELAALQRTIGTTGISIVINALAVGLGFIVLLAAGGQHIRRFGGLTALTILLSALFTLTVLPALLFWLKPKFLQRAAASSNVERAKKGSVT